MMTFVFLLAGAVEDGDRSEALTGADRGDPTLGRFSTQIDIYFLTVSYLFIDSPLGPVLVIVSEL